MVAIVVELLDQLSRIGRSLKPNQPNFTCTLGLNKNFKSIFIRDLNLLVTLKMNLGINQIRIEIIHLMTSQSQIQVSFSRTLIA